MRSLAALFVVGAIGCSEPTASQPLPPQTSDASVPAPVPPPRSAFHRNPFGDAFQSDNLFVDGDFELTGRTDQAPWIVFNKAQATLNYDTGGRCRSGVRCAVIGVGDAIIGNMASPPVEDYEIQIYIRPDMPRCADAEVFTIDLANDATADSIQSLTTAPDVDGWCHFAGKAGNLAYQQPAVYISLSNSATSKTLHIDEASALPMSEVPVHGALPPMKHPDAIALARAQTAVDWIRSHRKFGRNAPRTERR